MSNGQDRVDGSDDERTSDPIASEGGDPTADFRPAPSGSSSASDISSGVRSVGLQLPCSFGDYELRERIGAGGMGVIYRAEQRSLNRTVAIKVIRDSRLAHPQVVERFQSEAEAAARLQHPHIVSIYEVGRQDGQPFFSMEWIDGISLDEAIRQRPLPARQAAQLMHKVALAVQVAHERGVIHRDLKPANILLDGAEEPHITDFGLAKIVEHESELTATGQILGTPAYMAPEQASGEAGVSADIYGLGATLYALLSGGPPFRADSPAATLQQVQTNDAISPRRLNPSVPRDLATLCLKCLEKRPQRRYASAAELADELQRFLEGRPIVARPLSSSGRAWRFARRNPLTCLLAALFILALLGGTGTALYFGAQAQSRAVQAQQRASAATRETARANVATRRSFERLVRLNTQNGWESLQRGDPSSAAHWFVEAARLDRTLPNREPFHWIRLGAIRDRCPQPVRIWFHQGPVVFAEWDAEGKRVLSAGADGMARVWDIASGKPLTEPLEHAAKVQDACFSPDGQWVATATRDGLVHVWESASGRRVGKPLKMKDPVWHVAFSPDSKTLAACSGDKQRPFDNPEMRDIGGGAVVPIPRPRQGEIRRWSIPSLLPSGRPLRLTGQIDYFEFSPGGDRIAAGVTSTRSRTSQALAIWNIDAASADEEPSRSNASVAPQHRLQLSQPIHRVRFSPDGKRLVAAGGDISRKVGRMRVWETEGGEPLGEERELGDWIADVEFDATGQRLVTGTWSGTVEQWQVDGGPSLNRWELPGHVTDVAYSEDAERIAASTTDAMAFVWSVADTSTPRNPLHHGGVVTSVALRQGRVLTTSEDSSVRLWELPQGPQVREWKYSTQAARATYREPDQLLVTTGTTLHRVSTGSTDSVVATIHPDTFFLQSTSELVPSEKSKQWIEGYRLLAVDARSELALFHRNATGEKRKLQVWDLKTERPLGPVVEYLHDVVCTAFDPRRRWIALGDEKGKVWYLSTGTKAAADVPPSISSPNPIAQLACSSDGNLIAVTSGSLEDGRVVIYRPEDAQVVSGLSLTLAPMCLAFSPDDEFLAIGTGRLHDDRLGVAIVIRRDDAGVVGQVEHPGRVTDLTWDASGRLLVTASSDGMARCWTFDESKLQPSAATMRHQRRINQVTFNHDGTLLATASDDGTARVWDAATGLPITPNLAHDGIVWDASFHPASETLVTASSGGVRIWNLPRWIEDPERYQAWATLVSGQRFDELGNRLPARPGELQRAWNALPLVALPQ